MFLRKYQPIVFKGRNIMKPQPINLKPQQLGSIMITLDVLGASATMDFEQITSSFFILFVSISGIIAYSLRV